MLGKKIGIMGGTFDPVHYGHLMLAEQIRTSFYLDEIIFIPVGKAPHKAHDNAADKYQRYEMTKLAIESNDYFSVSNIETKREDTTYTIDTIKQIKSQVSNCDHLYFITGADAILLLDSWKNYQELVKLVTFVAATRPGIDLDRLNEKVCELRKLYDAKIEVCYIPALAISSTDIRRRVNDEKSIRYLLPETVENYIDSHGLYKIRHEKYNQMSQFLKKNLSKSRYIHTVQTSKMARKLAKCHGGDLIKAEFAGLCHDFAKEIDRESMLNHINKFNIFFDPTFRHNPNLAHGEVGAELLKSQFDLHDEEILDAVRWHTYGFKYMSLLSKIVYVADIIEPTRVFEGVEKLRHLAFENLDAAMLEYDKMNQGYLSNGVHQYTKEMIEVIKNKEQK